MAPEYPRQPVHKSGRQEGMWPLRPHRGSGDDLGALLKPIVHTHVSGHDLSTSRMTGYDC